MEQVFDEYSRLLATELEKQRQVRVTLMFFNLQYYGFPSLFLCLCPTGAIVAFYCVKNQYLSSVFTPLPQNYESLLAEAKGKRDSTIAEAVEKAVTSEMQDIQSKLDKCTEEKNALAEVCFNVF